MKILSKRFWIDDWGMLIIILTPIELFMLWAYWPFGPEFTPLPARKSQSEMKEFRELNEAEKIAIIELTSKTNERIVVLDQFQDDGLECIIVRFHTWKAGTIRCTIYHINHETAAAFRFPDSHKARLLMQNFLIERLY